MASTYALPATAMTHSHSHAHLHSHSHSPSRQYPANSPRSLRQERPITNLHSHSFSDIDLLPHSHSRGHSHEREHSPLKYLPTPPDSTGLPPIATFEKQMFRSGHNHSQSCYAPPEYTFPPEKEKEKKEEHHHHDHGVTTKPVEPPSRFTALLLPRVRRWPLIWTILQEKDSRRIFYFMSLNFAFMMVQAFYGYLTDSLGLLSDSIHMFFDCLALGVGLFAAVASKWPPSERFPYGFGKIESLSGFGNGIFLMLISVEIMLEAVERLAEGRATKRLTELFVVSGLGLAVNLVGMACFGHHGHAGHDHGSHSHSHDHNPDHDHSHSHDEKHEDHDHHDHDHSTHTHDSDNQSPLIPPSTTCPTKAAAAKHHAHSHENENMHGIFLHVLADTMGSAAVMVSTLLIHFFGWNGFDPLASCIIAVLIFLSSIPLIKSSARKLLLTIPDETEYGLREVLAGVSDVRGVGSYRGVRFWVGDGLGGGGGGKEEEKKEGVLGVMHIVATRGSDLEDVRRRVREFLGKHGVEVAVQVEGAGDTSCWCSGVGGNNSSRGSGSF